LLLHKAGSITARFLEGKGFFGFEQKIRRAVESNAILESLRRELLSLFSFGQNHWPNALERFSRKAANTRSFAAIG
jgi:hypothetical protein